MHLGAHRTATWQFNATAETNGTVGSAGSGDEPGNAGAGGDNTSSGAGVLDLFATFFAGSLLLLPFFANEIFGVGVRGLGLLVSAPAVGSLAASAWLSTRAPIRRQGFVVLSSVLLYGASIALFGASKSFPLALLLLACSGAADSVSTVVRQVVRQTMTPDDLRGRMTSINMNASDHDIRGTMSPRLHEPQTRLRDLVPDRSYFLRTGC